MYKSLITLISIIALVSCSKNETLPEEVIIENTPATFSGVLSAEMDNLTSEVSNLASLIDPDEGEAEFIEQSNIATSYGSFSITTSGTWTYILDTTHADIINLLEGSSLSEVISFTSIDGSSASITITIIGVPFDELENNNNGGDVMGFDASEGGNHIDGYTDAVPIINCTQTVRSLSSFEDAAESLAAGDTLCLADGDYRGDLELRIEGQGTAKAPITVAAQNPGKAIIANGEISVRLGGKHIVLQGLVFRNGESGSSIIKFEKETECYYCRVTEMSIIDMDNGDYDSSKWIEYYGQYNRIDHSWFSGKESRGALMVLPRWTSEADFNQNGFPEDRAQIDYNYFGDRPPAWGRGYASSNDNEYESVRLGLSTTHSAPSYSVLEYNYFERVQGEAEIISNKSANNTIRHNTVRDSNGSVVTRHGSNVNISNNFIFGDDNPFSGGIRLVDDAHSVTNNYIEGARFLNSNWNGGIVLTTGDGSGDTDNGYQNVENVLVAYNTITDSVNSLNVSGGRNTTAPKNIYFVNNIIAGAVGDMIKTNDEGMPANSVFSGNYIFGQSFSDNDSLTSYSGLTVTDPEMTKDDVGLYRPSNSMNLTATTNVDTGSFNLPTIDMDGQTRTSSTTSGADESLTSETILAPLTSEDVGPINYRPTRGKVYVQKVDIINYDFDSGDLTGWTDQGGNGASIITDDDVFSRGNTLKLESNSAVVTQTVTLSKNTNYTLSAFMKGAAKLAIVVDGQKYVTERNSTSYAFSSISFNSADAVSAVISMSVDDFVAEQSNIINSNFDEGQFGWTVVEGTGIGQVQDSDNSASGANGSIKFKWNSGDDSGTPHNPYISQTVAVEPHADYKLSIYNLYKSDDDNSSVLFGVATAEDVTEQLNWLASKDSIYSELKSAGNNKGDDSFYQDTLLFNSGENSSLTVFAQFKSTTGAEIRVDKFNLSYQGQPAEGTNAFFDSIRLVSHPLSEFESKEAEEN